MKTVLFLVFFFGAGQFALANSVVPRALLVRVDLGLVDSLTFGGIHGSLGFLGALCFFGTIASRLKCRDR